MPLDILCPSCRSPFPVTNDGPEFHVECPECDAGIGVSVAHPDAGKIGSVPQASARLAAAPAARRVPATAPRSLDDAPTRRTGSASAWVVILGSAVGLVLVLAGVGTTGYFLFTNLDTDDPPAARTTSTPGGPTGTPGGVAPRPGSISITIPAPNPNVPRPGPSFNPPSSIPRPAPPPSRPSSPRPK